MSSQSGDTAAKLLMLLVVVAIAGAVASPWLLRSSRTDDENRAVDTLRSIYAAQREHHGAGLLYGSMSKLTNAKLLEGPYQDRQFRISNYLFYHSTDGTMKRFCAEAVSERGKPGRSFGIDESGTVVQYESGISPCYNGVLRSAGSPVR